MENGKLTSGQAYREKRELFARLLENFIANPDETAVHDLRTTVRRLESSYRALPRQYRSKSILRYHKEVKRLFRRCSHMRDCDVMVRKLRGQGVPKKSKVLQRLKASRKETLPAALKKARQLQVMELPDMPASAESNPCQINLTSRLWKHARRFLEMRPLVMADEDRVDEVHDMRKDAKKLVYLLEQDGDLVTRRQLIELKMFQRLTGEIHDIDVAMDFLNEHHDCGDTRTMFVSLGYERHVLYRELVGLLQDEHWLELRGLEAAA